ncbi:UNVERIFIED_ORG: hypothetical protein J2S29_002208 [Rhizobium sp. SLBN-170]
MGSNLDKAVKIAVIAAAGLISAWMVFFVFLTSHSAACMADAAIKPEMSWWGTHVQCLPLNAIGDTLSGTFAPLAFTLLLTTVLLQIQQIRATREQLIDTQDALNFERAYTFFEKQIDVYNALRTVQLEYLRSQTLPESSRSSLVSVERLGRHLFGQEVADWIKQINDKSALVDQAVADKGRLEKEIQRLGGGYGPHERDRLQALSKQEEDNRAWLRENLTANKIDDRLNKLIRAPRVKSPKSLGG